MMTFIPPTTLEPIRPEILDDEIRQMAALIWSAISAQSALRDLAQGNHRYYLVIYEGKRVGIIGHELKVRPNCSVSLMFSGILPGYRRRGLFRSAFADLERRIAKEFPTADFIREVGPMRIREPFEHLGFFLIEAGSETSETILHKKIDRHPNPLLKGTESA